MTFRALGVSRPWRSLANEKPLRVSNPGHIENEIGKMDARA
jgi:hypothetical protein